MSNGTGRIRQVDYDQECGRCNKIIGKGTDFVYYHKGDYSKRWVMPVHVECYKSPATKKEELHDRAEMFI